MNSAWTDVNEYVVCACVEGPSLPDNVDDRWDVERRTRHFLDRVEYWFSLVIQGLGPNLGIR